MPDANTDVPEQPGAPWSLSSPNALYEAGSLAEAAALPWRKTVQVSGEAGRRLVRAHGELLHERALPRSASRLRTW
nr:hypothetical protein [Streptomyces sp. DSM 41633]